MSVTFGHSDSKYPFWITCFPSIAVSPTHPGYHVLCDTISSGSLVTLAVNPWVMQRSGLWLTMQHWIVLETLLVSLAPRFLLFSIKLRWRHYSWGKKLRGEMTNAVKHGWMFFIVMLFLSSPREIVEKNHFKKMNLEFICIF